MSNPALGVVGDWPPASSSTVRKFIDNRTILAHLKDIISDFKEREESLKDFEERERE